MHLPRCALCVCVRLCERVLACLVGEYILVLMCACACVSVCWRALWMSTFSCTCVRVQCTRLCPVPCEGPLASDIVHMYECAMHAPVSCAL